MATGARRFKKIEVQGRWQVCKINDSSDGEQRHWPGKPQYRESSEENYLILLATAWIQQDGQEQPGVNYYLDKLPDGYAVFEMDQPGGGQVYKRLFGHPTGRFFDSCVRYQVHFLWLMSRMEGDCTCVLCKTKLRQPFRTRAPRNQLDLTTLEPPRQSRTALAGEISGSSTRDSSATGIAMGRAKRDPKQSGAAYAVDEEGTEDVFKLFIKRLESAKSSNQGIDYDIKEKNSIDWRAEHEYDGYGTASLSAFLSQIEHQHSFIPRVGELVLWCPDFLDDHYLMLDDSTGEYKFYSFDQKCFHGFPTWRAGVVTDVPSAPTENGPVDFPDLLEVPVKKTALNTAGFRIETFPDPNDSVDKSLSKQYRFTPLRNIRPLSHWQMVLRGIPEKRLHPSIKNALTCTTSISLIEKFKAIGTWPNASILNKGIYIGSELITLGDTIRIASSDIGSTSCTDVLIVDSIRLNLIDITPEHISPNSPLLSSKTSISLIGRAFTLNIRRHFEMPSQQDIDSHAQQIILPPSIPSEDVKTLFRPVGTAEYGAWYPLHHPTKKYEVSYDRVLGRLYEADAVRLWTGRLQHKLRKTDRLQSKPSLDFDVRGIISARRYATNADSRLPEPTADEVLWFWADTRAEALAVGTFNGLQVGKYYDVRDNVTLKSWHTKMRIINGLPVAVESLMKGDVAENVARRGRPPGSKIVNGKLVLPGDQEYEDAIKGADGIKHKAKTNSQMAGAALISTDEEDGESDEDGNNDDIVVSTHDEGNSLAVVNEPPPARNPGKKPPRTKEQIMTEAVRDSIEPGYDFDENYLVSDEDWYDDPLPPARGGTEESEGGDYRPGRVE